MIVKKLHHNHENQMRQFFETPFNADVKIYILTKLDWTTTKFLCLINKHIRRLCQTAKFRQNNFHCFLGQETHTIDLLDKIFSADYNKNILTKLMLMIPTKQGCEFCIKASISNNCYAYLRRRRKIWQDALHFREGLESIGRFQF